MKKKSRIYFASAMTAWLSVLLFSLAIMQYGREKRLTKDPITTALIEKVWIETSRRFGDNVYGTVSFQRTHDGVAIPCRLQRLRLGVKDYTFKVGQLIQLAPRSDSCFEPDVFGGGRAETSSRAYAFFGFACASMSVVIMTLLKSIPKDQGSTKPVA